MIRITARKPAETARQILERVTQSRQFRRKDYFLLTSVILADTSLTDAERRQINRLFDDVQAGHLPLID